MRSGMDIMVEDPHCRLRVAVEASQRAARDIAS
jgi:hypothetical protein